MRLMAPRVHVPEPADREPERASAKDTSAEVAISRDCEDDSAAMIPFRISKRLQGAIFRIIRERDGGYANHNVASKDRSPSSTLLLSRASKRQNSPPKQIDSKVEATVREDLDETSVLLKDIGCRKRRRKSSTVHFAEPLFVYIEDHKGIRSSSKVKTVLPHSRSVHAAREASVASSSANHYKQPLSCFDLLCSHIGPRGWRCYRSTMEGKSVCNYHQGQTSTSVDT